MARTLTERQQRFLEVLFEDVTSGGGIFYLPPKEGANE